MCALIQLDSNAAAIAEKLRAFGPAMAGAIVRTLDHENQVSISVIDETKLKGPRPQNLGVVTGRLYKSIRSSYPVVTSNGVSSAIGSNIVYAGVHEYGIDAMVTVREHERKINVYAKGRKFYKTLDKGGHIVTKQRPVKEVKGMVTVRAHQMHMKFPARAYIRGVLEQRASEYSSALSASIFAAWEANGRN